MNSLTLCKEEIRKYCKKQLKNNHFTLNEKSFLKWISKENVNLDKKNIGVYNPTIYEPNPFNLYADLINIFNCELSFPIIVNKEMFYFHIQNIIPDIVIIPCLATYKNYRLGYGGGYFDKFLSVNKNIFSIGITCIKTEYNFVESHDIELKKVFYIEK